MSFLSSNLYACILLIIALKQICVQFPTWKKNKLYWILNSKDVNIFYVYEIIYYKEETHNSNSLRISKVKQTQ